ncbi:coat protein [Artemisia annua]|uniref:Coat protein n=1 Tax=Artemisia annua TaxID=35608 RepID=A0A2U1MLF1_ARTAN|nr:coat protein [Artemisia annua]
MDTVSKNIEELQALMEKLQITQITDSSEDEIETLNRINEQKIVLGESSDESEEDSEQNYNYPNYEVGDSSKSRKRGMKYEDYVFHKGYHKKGKTFVEEQKYQESIETEVLDINCGSTEGKMEKINNWSNKISLDIQVGNSLKELSLTDLYAYVMHKTSGSAMSHLRKAQPYIITSPEYLITGSVIEAFKYIVRMIYREFTGRDSYAFQSDIQRNAESIKAYNHIINMRICDMCLLEPFLCEYETWFYKIDRETQLSNLDLIFRKLPSMVGTKTEEHFKISYSQGNTTDTLGGRIKAIEEWMNISCENKIAKKEAQISLCCSRQNNINLPGNYGCDKPRRYKKYKKRKYRYKKWKQVPYKKKYKSFYKKNKRQNYFRKRKQDEKKKFCPSGKSSCRCWLCKEEGHYANNCPKKNSNTAKPMIEIFNLVKQVGYEPLEDSDFDSETEYIAYISESEYSNDE